MNYHKYRGFKWHRFIILWFWRSELQNTSQRVEIKESAVVRPLLETLGEQNSLISQPLEQGCQTHFHQGPHQPHGCLQRSKIILGLYKCNYSLTVKELKWHSVLWRQPWGWCGLQWKGVWQAAGHISRLMTLFHLQCQQWPVEVFLGCFILTLFLWPHTVLWLFCLPLLHLRTLVIALGSLRYPG